MQSIYLPSLWFFRFAEMSLTICIHERICTDSIMRNFWNDYVRVLYQSFVDLRSQHFSYAWMNSGRNANVVSLSRCDTVIPARSASTSTRRNPYCPTTVDLQQHDLMALDDNITLTKRLIISGLTLSISQSDLRQRFGSFGSVTSIICN